MTKVWRLNADPAGIDGASPEGEEIRRYHNLIYHQPSREKIVLCAHDSTPNWPLVCLRYMEEKIFNLLFQRWIIRSVFNHQVVINRDLLPD